MSFKTVTEADWRALVERELQGKSFEKTLVDGGVLPLYTKAPVVPRFFALAPIRLVMRHRSVEIEAVNADLEGGADALWFDGVAAPAVERVYEEGRVVSALPAHAAGADAVAEIATVLVGGASGADTLRVAVGRETFIEICKLRALRICWQKMCVVNSVPATARVHAVASARTLTVRDPWVNMLRVTTQAFAAMLGGADDFTPASFDEAFGVSTALGRRVARNTALVLRDESMLSHVVDPAAGSYFFDTLTDSIAREAWQLFQNSGTLAARIAASARERAERIAKRKSAIVGVSEFVNLSEILPASVPASASSRDAAPFEALRARADAHKPEVVLLTLGTFADARPRAGFAANFFAIGGFTTREVSTAEAAPLVCLCGTDAAYAASASALAAELKARGCKRVLLAGRPQAALTGIDDFIFMGSDAVSTLGSLLDVHP